MTRVPGNFNNASCAVFDPSTIALLTVMSPQTADRQRLIDRTIRTLKALSLWDKLDVLCLVGADQTSSLLNWKQNGVGNATVTGTVPFVANRPWVLPGTSGNVINTQFKASAGINYIQDSAFMAVWFSTPLASNPSALNNAGDILNVIRPVHSTATQSVVRINTATLVAGTQFPPSGGLMIANRSTSALMQVYGNTTVLFSGASTSAAPSTAFTFLGGRTATDPSIVSNIPMWAMGGSLSATDAANLYTITQTYLSAIGAS